MLGKGVMNDKTIKLGSVICLLKTGHYFCIFISAA